MLGEHDDLTSLLDAPQLHITGPVRRHDLLAIARNTAKTDVMDPEILLAKPRDLLFVKRKVEDDLFAVQSPRLRAPPLTVQINARFESPSSAYETSAKPSSDVSGARCRVVCDVARSTFHTPSIVANHTRRLPGSKASRGELMFPAGLGPATR